MAVTTGPVGGVPVAVPVLWSEPLVTSVEVVEYVALHCSDAPAASVGSGQTTADSPGMGSVTPTPVSVVVPVLVTS